MIGKLRAILWHMPHEKHSVDHLKIVHEFPPLGSRFTDRGGYFTPADVCITRSLRTRVMDLKRAYMSEVTDQAKRIPSQNKAIMYAENRPRPLLPLEYGQEPLAVRKRPQVPQTGDATRVYAPQEPRSLVGPKSGEQSTSDGSCRTNEYLVNPVGLQINWAKYPIQPRDAGN